MNHLFVVRDYLIENINFLNEYNCDIDNNAVFDSAAQSNDEPYCAVISHSFSDEAVQSGDINNQIFDWRVLINFFCALRGTRDEQSLGIQDGYVKTRLIIDSLLSDFTLNGNVMDCKVHAVTTPMTYSRSDRDEYFMIGIMLTIKEALNG